MIVAHRIFVVLNILQEQANVRHGVGDHVGIGLLTIAVDVLTVRLLQQDIHFTAAEIQVKIFDLALLDVIQIIRVDLTLIGF